MKILWIIFVIMLTVSCSSARKGQLGQLGDSFIDDFDVQDESINKFIKKKDTEATAKKIVKKEVSKNKKEKTYPAKYLKYNKKYKKMWRTFTPSFIEGEKYLFSVYFWGIRVGSVQLETEKNEMVAGKHAYHISGKLRSASFYEYIYSFDDRLDSFISVQNNVPLKFVLRQRESKQDVDDLQLFDHEKKKTFFLYRRVKKGKTKKKKKLAFIPIRFQDTFSSFYFLKGMPLKLGDQYEFPIVSRTKVKIFKVKVVKYETIEVMDEDVESVKLEASTFLPGVLKAKSKVSKDKIIFWFSRDKTHRFLRVQASVKLGSLSGEIQGYCSGPTQCSGGLAE